VITDFLIIAVSVVLTLATGDEITSCDTNQGDNLLKFGLFGVGDFSIESLSSLD